MAAPYSYDLREKAVQSIERVSTISAWWCGSIVAPMVLEGYCNTTVVCEWINIKSG
jgi:hypothetical protein